MDDKLNIVTNLFENTSIRSVWDKVKEEYYFSVIDVIMALTDNDYQKSRNYWKWLKNKLNQEGSELVSKTNRLKMQAQDGKLRETDTLDTKGYDNNWIKMRLTGIVDRFKLTDAWKENGINTPLEYGILTNEIYKSWSGMSASEYKAFKGIRKESLRDNMTDIEVALTDLGEIATRELVKEHKPYGLAENREIVRRGGNIARGAKENLEQELGRSVISNTNALNYCYLDENLLENKVSDKNEQ